MTEAEARQALQGVTDLKLLDDGSFFAGDPYFSFTVGEEDACLDGNFTADQLEAIACLMRRGGSK